MKKCICRFFGIAFLSTGAFAQISQTLGGPGVSTHFSQNSSGGWSGTATFDPPRFSRPPVTGAPFSAEESSQHIQTLSNGVHITRLTRGPKVYRDSPGRTRTE